MLTMGGIGALDWDMDKIRQQDEELDELSVSVQRIGGVGLTIHDELVGQERILEDLSLEMETTSNRLDFVQKKVAMVMKKAGAKGQFVMIGFSLLLFIILFILVFLTYFIYTETRLFKCTNYLFGDSSVSAFSLPRELPASNHLANDHMEYF